jgi:chromosome segregation protein
VASLRAVAEEAVNRERAKLEPLVAERDHLLDERDRATAEHSALRERLEIVEQEHAELAHHRRSVLESAQAQVAALEQDLAAEKDRQSVLAIALSAARSDSQLLAKREGELEATAAELEEASTGWRSAEEEAARLRSELGAARESAQEADAELRRLAAALHDYDEELKSERLRAADAAKAGERAARDAAELERQRDAARNELRRIAEAAQRSEALAARVRDLEQELEQARRALGAANAELEQLKVRLQAVHAALQNGG